MKRPIVLEIITALFLLGSYALPAASAPTTGATTLISVSSGGVQGNGESSFVSLSANGRYAVFQSNSDNLASGSIQSHAIYARDLQTGQTVLISTGYDGTAADSYSSSPDISADGRFIAFESMASNLVMTDTNHDLDIFVHDRDADEDFIFDEPGQVRTVRVSVSSSGEQGHGGEYGLLNRVPITNDGRYVVFHSAFTNLVPNDTNNANDIFVHDMQTGQTIRVSVASNGSEGNKASESPDISADGRFIVYRSEADNLVANDTNPFCENNGISNQNCPDIFLYDRDADGDGIFDEPGAVTTSLISVNSNGTQANNASDYFPRISADGQWVVFGSFASNLAGGDMNNTGDIFLRDRRSGETKLVSMTKSGIPGNDFSGAPFISDDGRFVGFASLANNLAPGDTNDKMDVFVRDLLTRSTVLASIHTNGTVGNDHSNVPSISATGNAVVFHSYASNLIDHDENFSSDVFMHLMDWPALPDHFIFLPAIHNQP